MSGVGPPDRVHITYTQQFRRCGKANCLSCKPGTSGHGPYWYAYWRQDGRVRTRYLGKQAPVDMHAAVSLASLASDTAQQTGVSPHSVLRVRTLGAFIVWHGDDLIPATQWGRRGAARLFKCLLSASGHRLHREQLVELLWPHASPPAGGSNLRVALHWLRKIVDRPGDSYLRMKDGWLTLAPALSSEPMTDWLDADRFAHLAQQALMSQDIVNCCAALKLYGGEYLPDDRYAEWALGRREELNDLYRNVLLHAADLSIHQGSPDTAVPYLEDLLRQDLCHEEAIRSLMQVHAAAGRRTAAIRAYWRFATNLKHEMDLKPEPATQALYRVIQRARTVAT